MVVDLAHDSLLDGTSGSLTLVILNDRLARLLTGTDNLESRETLNAHGATELLVGVFIAVDGSDLSKAIEVLGSLLIGGLEVLTVTTPRSVELDNRGVVGLGNEIVVVLSIDLKNGRVLGIDGSLSFGQSRKRRCQRYQQRCGVMHREDKCKLECIEENGMKE